MSPTSADLNDSKKVFEVGAVFHGLNAEREPAPNAPENEWVHYLWPKWCVDTFPARLNFEKKPLYPVLTEWERVKDEDTDVERFTVDCPHQFEYGIDLFLSFFRTSRRDPEGRRPQTVDHIELDSGLFLFELNYAKLPDSLPWPGDSAIIPDDDYTLLGMLQSGHEAILDWRLFPHLLLCGATRSGKTRLAIILAFSAKMNGCDGAVMTPTLDDQNLTWMMEPTFVDAEHGRRKCKGWDVVAGQSDELMIEMAAQAQRVLDEMARREKDMAAAGRETYDGPRYHWIVDEFADLATPLSKHEPKPVKEARFFVMDAIAKVGRKGAKVKISSTIIIQDPYAELLGGSLSMISQSGARIGIKSLAPARHSVLFPQGQNEPMPAHIGSILNGHETPHGRGIARGLRKVPNVKFSKTHDTPIQIFDLPQTDARAMILSTHPDTGADTGAPQPNPFPESTDTSEEEAIEARVRAERFLNEPVEPFIEPEPEYVEPKVLASVGAEVFDQDEGGPPPLTADGETGIIADTETGEVLHRTSVSPARQILNTYFDRPRRENSAVGAVGIITSLATIAGLLALTFAAGLGANSAPIVIIKLVILFFFGGRAAWSILRGERFFAQTIIAFTSFAILSGLPNV